jgi:hypothetical protein
MSTRELYLQVDRLSDILIEEATADRWTINDKEFRDLRFTLVQDLRVRPQLPEWLVKARSLADFFDWIKEIPLEERRSFIRAELEDLLSSLEMDERPGFGDAAGALAVLNSAHVIGLWNKAVSRRQTDPDGSITAARSLVETVCKHILDSENVPYRDDDDLPTIYKAVSKLLNIAPTQHQEQAFKKILGGMLSTDLSRL